MADNDYTIFRKTLDLLKIPYEHYSTKTGKGFVLSAGSRAIIVWFRKDGMFIDIR